MSNNEDYYTSPPQQNDLFVSYWYRDSTTKKPMMTGDVTLHVPTNAVRDYNTIQAVLSRCEWNQNPQLSRPGDGLAWTVSWRCRSTRLRDYFQGILTIVNE
jgi:hypothetical protein